MGSKYKIGLLLIQILLVVTLAVTLWFVLDIKRGGGTNTPNPTISLTASPTSTPIQTISPTTSPTQPPSPSPTSTPKLIKVDVYFSKSPESYDDPTFLIKTSRTTNRIDVGTFSIEQLIAGPTSEEKKQGLVSTIALSGESNCSGKDFSLSIDKNKKATLKFCKLYISPGTMADARIINSIDKTLKQFPTIEKIVILTYDDHCFGDLSGLDICKGI